ncbi:MAG: aminoglycoside phosphotransferase family protein [Pyrinomonadaceae bacterium]
MSEFFDRLQTFLRLRRCESAIETLTADASTREYFRIAWAGRTAVACVYPTAAAFSYQTYLDVTQLFLAGGLPVPEILDFDDDLLIVIQEDLGDRILRDAMLEADAVLRSRLRDEAITMIARVQTATVRAFETESIASSQKFDREKLEWELNFFKTHYFESYLQRPLLPQDNTRLSAEFVELATELESFATVLCHRDFHAANLMLDARNKMRIIDHQDARIGSPSYDLVSLLLDRITHLPSTEWLAKKRKYFLDVRQKLGLARLDEDAFAYEFRLQTIQRCLKAAGTFSFQSANRDKQYFIPFIKPMFAISIRGAESLGRFPAIREILGREMD